MASIQYDPNRSANIALIHYVDGEKRYIIAPLGLKVGDKIVSSKKGDTEIKEGNSLALEADTGWYVGAQRGNEARQRAHNWHEAQEASRSSWPKRETMPR